LRTDKDNHSRTGPSGDKGVKSRRHLHVLLIASLLALHFGLLVSSLNQTSVTADEASHLAIGYGFLESGDAEWLILNPPLQRSLAALPLLFQSVEFDAPTPEKTADFWHRGHGFMASNLENYHGIFMSARSMVCLLSCFAGLLVYTLGRQVLGAGGGLVSLFFYSLSPAVLAHGGLVTTDLSAAVAGLAMITGIIHYRSKQSLPALIPAGLGFSLVFITKFNALIFLPIGMFLLALPKRVEEEGQESNGPKNRAIDILVVLAISWLVLCASYLFQGLFTKPSDLCPESSLLGFINVLPDWLRLPAPAAYLKAMDLQLADVLGDQSVYLFGKRGPSFWYFPACLLFKASLPMLVLFITGLFTCNRKTLYFVVLPGLFFFIVMGLITKKQMGLRMVLPALPFMFVIGGCAAARLWKRAYKGWKRNIVAVLLGLALAWHFAFALLSYPHYIGAFNELAGGPCLPHHGHRFLADSNLDWGQDWIRLARWQDKNNVDNLSLAYFGIVDPALYGVEYEPDDCELKPGHLAVSANLVLGLDPYVKRKCYTVLKKRGPDEKIGTSVWIYRIKD